MSIDDCWRYVAHLDTHYYDPGYNPCESLEILCGESWLAAAACTRIFITMSLEGIGKVCFAALAEFLLWYTTAVLLLAVVALYLGVIMVTVSLPVVIYLVGRRKYNEYRG